MTKSEAIALFGRNQADLARGLSITRSAVSQWPDDKPIPELQQLRIERMIAERDPKLLQFKPHEVSPTDREGDYPSCTA